MVQYRNTITRTGPNFPLAFFHLQLDFSSEWVQEWILGSLDWAKEYSTMQMTRLMSRLPSPMQTNPLMSQLPSPRTCRWLSWWASYFLWILTLHRWLACWVSCSLLRQKAHWMSWRQSTWLYVHLYKAQNSLAELTVIHTANCTLYKAWSSLVELTVIHMAICTGEKLTCWASWFLEAQRLVGLWATNPEIPFARSSLQFSNQIRAQAFLLQHSSVWEGHTPQSWHMHHVGATAPDDFSKPLSSCYLPRSLSSNFTGVGHYDSGLRSVSVKVPSVLTSQCSRLTPPVWGGQVDHTGDSFHSLIGHLG